MSDLTDEQRAALAEALYPFTDNPEWVADGVGPFVAHLLAEREAEALERLADDLTWVRPEACCGSAASCDAMQPSIPAVGAAAIRKRAQEARAKAPTP